MEVDCSRVKPEDSSRWTNFSVSKWCSLLRAAEAEKVRWRAVALSRGDEEGSLWTLSLRREAHAVRAKAVVAVVRWAEEGDLCDAGSIRFGRIV
jgi:hypothetical protein